MIRWCVVIPTYNNEKTLAGVIRDVLTRCGDVIVVNDGSTDSTAGILASFPEIQVISYPENRGKGYALKTAFAHALKAGYTHAITLDSDGQHQAQDIAAFVSVMETEPESLVVGSRKLPEEKMRQGSSFANRFSNFWFRLISGTTLPDTQSGFRLYPLQRIANLRFFTGRYEFELEVLIRSAWRGVPLKSIPIDVYYPERKDRISHFRPFRDFVRISLLYTVLVTVALLYVKPFALIRNLRRDNIRAFLSQHIFHSQDSTMKITFSVMLGVFMGIVPIWGYQLVTAIALAYLFRLNKLLVIVAANISLPPMIPLILYLSYFTGSLVLGGRAHLMPEFPITLDFVKNNLYQYVLGAILFAVILSLISGLVLYITLTYYRKHRLKPARP
jgi:glycosyltransferase involved in cell wall biosynthesis